MGDFDRPGSTENYFGNPAKDAVNALRFEALDLLQQAKQLPKTTAEQLLDRTTAVTDLRLSSDESPFKTLVSANLRERTGSLDFMCGAGTARLAVNGGEHATGLNNYFRLPHWQKWGYQFEAKSSDDSFSLRVGSPHARQAPELGVNYLRGQNATFGAVADFHAHKYGIEATRNFGDHGRMRFNFTASPRGTYDVGLWLEGKFR